MRTVTFLSLAALLACSPSTPDNDPGDVGPIGGDHATGGDPGGGGGDPGFNPSSVCGNNQLNGLETCDGAARDYASDCATLNAGTGATICTNDCVVSMAPCSGDACTGNGWYNDGNCDACDLAGGSADPDCAAECGANSHCADYYDDMLGVWTCAHAGFGRDPDCPECGDGVQTNLNPTELYAEWCDGNDFGGWTCANYNFDGGTLDCTSDCLVDTSGCTLINAGSECGNSSFEGYEECDPPETFLCSDILLSFGSGTASCTNDCTFDVSGCSVSDFCQAAGWYDDGRCDPCPLLGGHRDADCDGCASDGTCVDRFSPSAHRWGCDYNGGADPDCGVCGNNVREEYEFCDGVDMGGMTCEGSIDNNGWDFSGGVLACNPNCTLNFSRCIP